MRKILNKGVVVAGRQFEFLAFSTSQLKEQSTWFFAPSTELPMDVVRDFMGRFESITCVAKYAARMGQCFSSTVETVEVEAVNTLMKPDIMRNGYNFSDGGGLISSELAERVADILKAHGRLNSQLKTNPCAYQLRFGGCKGVLVHYPGLLTGQTVGIRPSMRKFESTANKIEVVGVSRYLPAFLNRQFISILYRKGLGIPDYVFKELQDAMLKTLNGMLTDSKQALHVLHDYASLDSELMMTGIANMIAAGFDSQKEPFLRGVLSTIRLHLLQDLKNKTRIFVPEAALLIGVVDELGVLEEGQIYVQIDSSLLQDCPQVITKSCIVAKNPCFHPGDVRLLQAVEEPRLSHLRNVVVFSQKGRRPVANEISGSDLDGDNFFVSWRQNLIPKKAHPPMEYPPAVAKELDRPVQMSDVAEFFVNHAISDNLGIIANAHLALADQSSKGVHDPRCLTLAQKHSEAVDFPKTGVVVEIESNLRPRKYPDFMQKKHKAVYQSQTIIGQLFREIVKEPTSLDLDEVAAGGGNVIDPDLVVDGYLNHMDSAMEHRIGYEQQLIQVMAQHGVTEESQLVTGCIVQWEKMNRRSNGKRFDARAHIVESVKALQAKHLRIFHELVNREQDEGRRRKRLFEMASAWYMATYDRTDAQATKKGPRLYSFPWVLDRYLSELKKSKRSGR